MAYEDALQELYQAPLAQFVAERKRLAGELKAGGDAAAAKLLLDRKRPPVSAWVVNQLYWHARDAFDEMLATAEQLRNGHLKASADHRDAIAKLRQRAAAILEDSGHAATEATLRRVTMTLAALAATGGFDPDAPGTLAADRDPPGFEAAGIPMVAADPAEPSPAGAHAHDDKQRELDRKREEEAQKRKQAERHRIEAALRTAKGELEVRERAVRQLENQLDDAKQRVTDAREAVDEIAAKLAELAEFD